MVSTLWWSPKTKKRNTSDYQPQKGQLELQLGIFLWFTMQRLGTSVFYQLWHNEVLILKYCNVYQIQFTAALVQKDISGWSINYRVDNAFRASRICKLSLILRNRVINIKCIKSSKVYAPSSRFAEIYSFFKITPLNFLTNKLF